MRAKVAVALALCLLTGGASAGYITGNELRNYLLASDRIDRRVMSSTDFQDAARGLGYIEGLVDGFNGLLVCFTEPVAAGQLAAVVMRYLEAHPEDWHKGAEGAVMNALMQSFPCKKK